MKKKQLKNVDTSTTYEMFFAQRFLILAMFYYNNSSASLRKNLSSLFLTAQKISL